MTTLVLAAIRPKTLTASISPVLFGISLAMSEGVFNPLLFVITLLTALLIQIGTNLANDYYDCLKGGDTHARIGPLRLTQAGLVSPKQMGWAFSLVFAAAALFGCYLVWTGGIAIGALLAISIALGILYTGGPFPLAYLGLGDLFVFIFFGPIAVAGTYFLQTHQWSSDAILIGIVPGTLSTAILTINNLRDVEEDGRSGKKTLVVRLGKLYGKGQYTLCILCSFIPLFFLYRKHPLCLLSALSLLPAIPLIISVLRNQNPAQLNPLLGKTGGLLFLYTCFFCIGWML